MSTQTYHLGIARVSLTLLTDFLHLPADHEIVGVRAKRGADGAEYEFEVLINGPLMPGTGAAEITPRVMIVHRLDIGKPQPSRKITCTFEPEPPTRYESDFSDWLKAARAETPVTTGSEENLCR